MGKPQQKKWWWAFKIYKFATTKNKIGMWGKDYWTYVTCCDKVEIRQLKKGKGVK